MNSEQTLIYLISLLTHHLNELVAHPRNNFIHGEMTAYVETLEVLQLWSQSTAYGLDYEIEDRYKI